MTNLLTPQQVMERLGIGRTTLTELIRSGELESVLIGKQMRRVPEDALETYVASLRTSAAPPDVVVEQPPAKRVGRPKKARL